MTTVPLKRAGSFGLRTRMRVMYGASNAVSPAAVMAGAEQHRLLAQCCARLEAFQDPADHVAHLAGIVAHADQHRLKDGRLIDVETASHALELSRGGARARSTGTTSAMWPGTP